MAPRFNLLKPVPCHAGEMVKKTAKAVVEIKAQTEKSVKATHFQPCFDKQKLEGLSRAISAIDPDSFPCVIVVANATTPQDKGLVAAHLASAISRMPDQNVLLIDADFSCPTLHTAFDHPETQGLAEYLTEERALSSVILKTSGERLQLISAGRLNGSSSDVLSSGKMARLIRELKSKCQGLVVMISMDLETLSKKSPSFTQYADGYVLSIDESILPETLRNKPFSFPGKAKLLGSIRTQNQNTSEMHSVVKATKKKQIEKHAVMSHQEKGDLIVLNQPGSHGTEQFNKLTADMIKADIFKDRQVFMFTSPSSGDGKSFVSSNAAVSLARNTGKQVLIIDCDLRSPSIHTYFSCENHTGLSSYLTDETVSFSDCIQATAMENLFVMTAGPIVTNPLQHLSSGRMTRFVDGLKKRFKGMIIILDAAPPSLMAEGSVVSRFADSVVLVASHNKTNRDSMKKLADMFDRDKIFGVIYNNYQGNQTPYSAYRKMEEARKAA